MPNSTPLFSIITPTYNRAWILPKTAEHVLQQTFTNWEWIIVDDGSTDDTAEVVKKLAVQDSRIRYIYQKNAKQAAARQHGLEEARGEWIVYMDSDDEIYASFLERAHRFFQQNPAVAFATSNMDRTIELHTPEHKLLKSIEQPPTEKSVQKITIFDYAQWNIKPCGTGLFHKQAIITPQIRWDSSFAMLEDLDFLLQLGDAYPDAFGYIPEKLFHYRQVFGTDGVCASAEYKDWADVFEQIYKKHQHSVLLKKQEWYPSKVEEYRKRQEEYTAEGKPTTAAYKYFPEFF